MSSYGFLWKEAMAGASTPHEIYRAVRAVWRLHQVGEISLPDKQYQLARRLERSLREFYEDNEYADVPSLPLSASKLFLVAFQTQQKRSAG